ncbi:hypothetical protein ACFQGE_01140 [Halomicroarcula sp. GCM10025817]|uniref:hypothetical protein n=1 Tax=Halomicroarcula sp. GCM10025817 TaxID=3252672 RepID=UPI00362218E2
MQLLKRLPDGYVVWDKAAEIRFRRPTTETVYATFEMPDEEVAAVQSALASTDSVDREYTVDLVGEDSEVCATVEKTVHVSTDEDKRV